MYKKYHNIRNITETKKSRRKKAHQNHTSPLPLPISQLPPTPKKILIHTFIQHSQQQITLIIIYVKIYTSLHRQSKITIYTLSVHIDVGLNLETDQWK